MKTILLVAALAIAGHTAQAATELVVNGSFEQGTAGLGSFQGWTTKLGSADTFVDSSGQTGTRYGQASDGLWAAYFGTPQASGGAAISQVLATVAGQSYVLSFDLANDNAGQSASNGFTAQAGGGAVLKLSNLANQDFRSYSLAFTASGASTSLTLSGFNDASWLELDKVSVSAVPEPASLALLLAGMTLLGWQARRSRRD